jgi:hypothetical protein
MTRAPRPPAGVTAIPARSAVRWNVVLTLGCDRCLGIAYVLDGFGIADALIYGEAPLELVES